MHPLGFLEDLYDAKPLFIFRKWVARDLGKINKNRDLILEHCWMV